MVQCVAVTEGDLEVLEQGLAEGVGVDAVVREAVLVPEPPLVEGVAATESVLRNEAVAELVELGGSVAEARAVELPPNRITSTIHTNKSSSNVIFVDVQ